jgi:4-hydroxyphenylpyruvate dioxygenase
MRRSIATVSLSGTLPEKLEAIAIAHFDGVEIMDNDLLFFNGSPRDARGMASDVGLTIDLFQPFRDFEGVSGEQMARNLERAERKFRRHAGAGRTDDAGMLEHRDQRYRRRRSGCSAVASVS